MSSGRDESTWPPSWKCSVLMGVSLRESRSSTLELPAGVVALFVKKSAGQPA